jgi:hypothetical protein
MQDFHDAVALMESAKDLMDFAGPRDPALVAAAEAAIGSRFPPTYREFVTRYGAGGFGAFEIDGVIDANFHKSSVPNGIWETLDERRTAYLPNDLLIVAFADDGRITASNFEMAGKVTLSSANQALLLLISWCVSSSRRISESFCSLGFVRSWRATTSPTRVEVAANKFGSLC